MLISDHINGCLSLTGRVAALSMMGRASEAKTVPYFWSAMFGKTIRYAGRQAFIRCSLKGVNIPPKEAQLIESATLPSSCWKTKILHLTLFYVVFFLVVLRLWWWIWWCHYTRWPGWTAICSILYQVTPVYLIVGRCLNL